MTRSPRDASHPPAWPTRPTWIRLLPEWPPARRARVVADPHCRPVVVPGGNISAALATVAGPVVVVEWDIAFDRDDYTAMEMAAQRWPFEVVAAPYRLWPYSTRLPDPVWAHRVTTLTGELRWVTDGAPRAEFFGLGLTYLPAAARELAAGLRLDWRDADTLLSRAWGRGAVICWAARPKHLHW